GKGSMYEGGIRVPFAMQWPSVIAGNTRYEEPIISLDMFATAVALAGVEPKKKLDGVNLIPYLTGASEGAPHEILFWRQYDSDGLAVRAGNMKLVRDKNGEKELYNLQDDISETMQLDNAEAFEQLSAQHQEWNSQNLDPVFLGLRHNELYNEQNPDRFENVEKY
ncbi:MAG: N-acetylgalactosamine 6-sulfate sulfatase, partial [Ekhidna sp.]|nr:N-acetylgalactosamine 6-sulfate sulfatase [Ekhidna sp.]